MCIAEYITWDSRLTDYQTVHAVIAVLCIQIDGIEEGLARYVDNHNPIWSTYVHLLEAWLILQMI